MAILLIQNMVKWLNAFPIKGWISEEMSPETIVPGASKPYFNRKYSLSVNMLLYIQVLNII